MGSLRNAEGVAGEPGVAGEAGAIARLVVPTPLTESGTCAHRRVSLDDDLRTERRGRYAAEVVPPITRLLGWQGRCVARSDAPRHDA